MSGHTRKRSHTPVKLVSVTPEAEHMILYIARVSSNQDNTDAGLLKYLIRNQHWSPFEHAMMTLEFRTSRAIAAQILRHRSFTFQEFSQRYAAATNFIVHEGRKPAESNRQSSEEGLDDETQQWWIRQQLDLANDAFETYNEAIERGIAKECARFILPLSTETKLYVSGTIRSWVHYLQQRTDEHAQLEHRELALLAQEIFVQEFPVTAEALGWTVS